MLRAWKIPWLSHEEFYEQSSMPVTLLSENLIPAQSPPGGAASPLPDSRLMGNEDVASPVWLNPCAKLLASPCDLHCHCMAQSTEMVAPSVVGCATLFHKIQLSKINLAHSSATFQVRKHTFKASVACNGREVLHGTPARAARHFGD